MSEITAEQYEAAVGHAPQDDDLERSNCVEAGDPGHNQCGWDHERNLPEFIAAAYRFKEQLDAGLATDLRIARDVLADVDHETICENNAVLQHLKARNAQR